MDMYFQLMSLSAPFCIFHHSSCFICFKCTCMCNFNIHYLFTNNFLDKLCIEIMHTLLSNCIILCNFHLRSYHSILIVFFCTALESNQRKSTHNLAVMTALYVDVLLFSFFSLYFSYLWQMNFNDYVVLTNSVTAIYILDYLNRLKYQLIYFKVF